LTFSFIITSYNLIIQKEAELKICRVEISGRIEQGLIIEQDVYALTGDWSKPKPGKKLGRLAQLNLKSPCVPSKIIAVGLNYKDHAKELNQQIPENPILFLKPASAVIGPGDAIIHPSQSQRVDYEAELAVVISRKARSVKTESAFDYILGYTCFNDVTARDLQIKDGQWTRAKSFDTFAPVGPWIETELDPSHLQIQAILNGKIVQNSNTSNLIFPLPELVAFISSVMTLLPGDVIATGTPAGIGPMKPGDEIVIKIEGIAELKNPVHSA